MMAKIFGLLLLLAGGAALAQTPAANLMPDGSRDMYLGLAALSSPLYEGARHTHPGAQAVVQVQWSNGVFISGMSAGLHLAQQPDYEYGPLLAAEGRRDDTGTHAAISYFHDAGGNGHDLNSLVPLASRSRLYGMDEIDTRLLLGGFYNLQLGPQWHWNNRLLDGYGNAHHGLRWTSDLQYKFSLPAAHHSLVASLGINLVNQAYNQAYFGVTKAEALRSGHPAYAPSGGIKDLHADLHWNWALSSSCILSSGLNWSRLNGAAADSPLVERRIGLSVSSALAYRF